MSAERTSRRAAAPTLAPWRPPQAVDAELEIGPGVGREMLLNYKEIQLKLEQMERQTLQNTEDIQSVFTYLRQLLIPVEQVERQRIGFRQRNEGN